MRPPMERWYSLSRYTLLGVLAVASLAMAAYDWWFVWPEKKCDEQGAWWDPKDHQCLDPMPIWRITGRRLPTPPAGSAASPGTKP